MTSVIDPGGEAVELEAGVEATEGGDADQPGMITPQTL